MDKPRVLLTTIDNPYNPFTQYNEWSAFDTEKGYHSNALLARFAATSSELSDAEYNVEVEAAIDRIMNIDASLKYCKAFEP